MRGRAAWRSGLGLVAGLCVAQAHGDATAPEYQVKAAFVYKFATYVRWPATSGADETTPFVIGVLGKDPFGPALDAVVRGESLRGKPIAVRRLARLEDARRCDVLFVSNSERGNLREIFSALSGAPVLTVGDMNRFAEQGGMINLFTTPDNRIRFEINRSAFDRAGLEATSQLLRLARIVSERRVGGR